MRNDWKEYHRRQRQRRLAQERANACLYSPAKSDDAIEAEATAMAAEENRVIERANAEIILIFAAARGRDRSTA